MCRQSLLNDNYSLEHKMCFKHFFWNPKQHDSSKLESCFQHLIMQDPPLRRSMSTNDWEAKFGIVCTKALAPTNPLKLSYLHTQTAWHSCSELQKARSHCHNFQPCNTPCVITTASITEISPYVMSIQTRMRGCAPCSECCTMKVAEVGMPLWISV